MNKKNFAVIGVGGYIAPRHLNAIKENNCKLVAAYDPKDSVGIIDSYGNDVDFFVEFERFDRFAEKHKRLVNSDKKIDFVSICSPNYLHDSHIRFALRIGANVICEKPLVLNPWNIDSLVELEKETGKRIYNVLQLRLHPSIVELKKNIESSKKNEKYEIELNYITPRGRWYFVSWKGDETKSGGVATNIGVHFFDMLIWIFGKVENQEVYYSSPKKMVGFIELEKARVKWFLSVDKEDLKEDYKEKNKAFRSITIDGNEINFSSGFTDLHTLVYKDILNGGGFGLQDVRPSIELVSKIRESKISIPIDKKSLTFLKENGLYNKK